MYDEVEDDEVEDDELNASGTTSRTVARKGTATDDVAKGLDVQRTAEEASRPKRTQLSTGAVDATSNLSLLQSGPRPDPLISTSFADFAEKREERAGI